MKDIIIYGLGNIFNISRSFLEKEFNIIGYSDQKNHKIDKFIKPEEIKFFQYEQLVVTSSKYYQEIREKMIYDYQIPSEKIISLNELLVAKYELDVQYGRNTSVTDDGIYPAFCKKAAGNYDIFAVFRRCPIVKWTYDITYEEGEKYAEVISENKEIIFSDKEWRAFQENDLYGMPEKNIYCINQKKLEISALTLRYIKVLQDIIRWYNLAEIKTIAEIGVGYGGQCRIIKSYLENVGYDLIDLPEVLLLAKAFLDKYELNGVRYIDGTGNIEKKRWDLVISNYAFSELNRDVQDFYIDTIIRESKAGYITWNSSSSSTGRGYSIEEILKKIKAECIEEIPLTYPGNCIIVWNRKM